MALYHKTLVEEGVDDYSLEDCWRSYRLNLFRVLMNVMFVTYDQFVKDAKRKRGMFADLRLTRTASSAPPTTPPTGGWPPRSSTQSSTSCLRPRARRSTIPAGASPASAPSSREAAAGSAPTLLRRSGTAAGRAPRSDASHLSSSLECNVTSGRDLPTTHEHDTPARVGVRCASHARSLTTVEYPLCFIAVSLPRTLGCAREHTQIESSLYRLYTLLHTAPATSGLAGTPPVAVWVCPSHSQPAFGARKLSPARELWCIAEMSAPEEAEGSSLEQTINEEVRPARPCPFPDPAANARVRYRAALHASHYPLSPNPTRVPLAHSTRCGRRTLPSCTT